MPTDVYEYLLLLQHFHYGYFLYAVAVVGQVPPDFVKTHKTAVMAIVRDIASPDQSE